jgi:hypothetical protein
VVFGGSLDGGHGAVTDDEVIVIQAKKILLLEAQLAHKTADLADAIAVRDEYFLYLENIATEVGYAGHKGNLDSVVKERLK